MKEPYYDRAIEYALLLLQKQLPPIYSYHSYRHTAFDVLPAVSRLARLCGISEAQRRLLEVAAAYHDLGFVRSACRHEDISIEILRGVLPRMRFASWQLDELAAMIDATRMPQSPKNTLQEILADADLDSLGRVDFIDTSIALWKEGNALGRHSDWPSWLERQIAFLQGHRYFTPQARALRDAGKAANACRLQAILKEVQALGQIAIA